MGTRDDLFEKHKAELHELVFVLNSERQFDAAYAVHRLLLVTQDTHDTLREHGLESEEFVSPC